MISLSKAEANVFASFGTSSKKIAFAHQQDRELVSFVLDGFTYLGMMSDVMLLTFRAQHMLALGDEDAATIYDTARLVAPAKALKKDERLMLGADVKPEHAQATDFVKHVRELTTRVSEASRVAACVVPSRVFEVLASIVDALPPTVIEIDLRCVSDDDGEVFVARAGAWCVVCASRTPAE